MYTLQILHASDLEGGTESLIGGDILNMAAVVDVLEDEVPNSLTLSTGDNFIPGPFFFVGDDDELQEVFSEVYSELLGEELPDIRDGVGRLDITLMNLIGFDASGVGNHEFDRGTETFASLIGSDIQEGDEVRWLGAQFPYLSANLDFSGDENLAELFTDEILPNTDFKANLTDSNTTATQAKIAPATIVEEGEESIGIVGVTTPLLEQLSSPEGVEVIGSDTQDTDSIAAIIQPTIDELSDQGINKIVLVSHLQQIQLEQELLPKLNDVDILISGSADVLLADEQDTLRPGDIAAGDYPIITTNATGEPALIVSTDSQYSYVGRLVVDFDENGIVIPESVNPEISGSYATTSETVAALWGDGDPFGPGTRGEQVQILTDVVEDIFIPQDAQIIAQTDVFLSGRREELRTEETNLGNLSADAILTAANQVDSTVTVAIKNGGGIRASIGTIDPNTNEELPPQGNPRSGKEPGEISQLDIENAFRFDDELVTFDLTAEELKAVLEHGVAESRPGETPGQFPQVGGLHFSFDILDNNGELIPSGERVQSLAVLDNEGNIADIVVRDGELVGDSQRVIRVVTLGFLAGGGDGYPFPELGENQINTGITEQVAVTEFLATNFSTTAFDEEDVPPELDERIQNLDFRDDTVLSDQTGTPTTGDDILTGTSANETIAGDLGDDQIFGNAGNDLLRGDLNQRFSASVGGNDTIIGGAGDDRIGGKAGNDELFGSEGNDSIWGDQGDDVLRGGLGDDRLQGDTDYSSGVDTFILAIAEGTDTIVDFEIGIDLIGLAEGLNASQLSLSLNGQDTFININSETLAILQDVNLTDFSQINFIAV
ncbi:MAG: 5'-nucleotidase C-terminal domain-containing protein [Cyanobacteria bacterium J06592_8]